MISRRRRSPPESWYAFCLRRCLMASSSSSVSSRRRRSSVVDVQRLEDRHHVVLDAELAEDRRLLRQIADPCAGALVHRQRRDVAVVEQDRPFVGTNQSGDHVERRRLPRPIGAEQTHDFSLGELERDVVHHPPALVRLHEVLGLEPRPTADDGMVAADRLAGMHRGFREPEEIPRRLLAIGRHAVPHRRRECHRDLAPQRPHRQHDHLEHGQTRQHGGGEIRARLIHGQAARVLRIALGVRAQLEERLAIGDGEVAERGAALIVRNVRERRRGERERRITSREEIGQPLEAHGIGGGGGGATGFVVSAGTGRGGRGSRCTPSALPATTTRSMRSRSIATVIRLPRE